MKVGYIQTSPLFGEKQKNLDAVGVQLTGIKADLVVLPELFATGYAFASTSEAESLSEDTEGPTSLFLCQKSRETGSTIVAGFIERSDGCLYNSSMIVSLGKVIGTYRKLHLFNKEKLFFSPGDHALHVYTVNGFKIGIMICFDWIFPEVSRSLTLQGAQIIAHPSNLVLPHCHQAMITRCLENRIFAVTANRVGTEKRGEDEFTFTGRSQITSSDGEILSSASPDDPCSDFIEIDLNKSNNKMINPFNDVIGDRRPEFYL